MQTSFSRFWMPTAFIWSILFYSCTSEREKSIERLTVQEQSLLSDTVKVIDPQKGAAMLKAYADFVRQFPGDSLNPEYLFKAADIAQGLSHDKLALEYYTMLVDSYPSSKKVAAALFMKGFVFQNSLNDKLAARVAYQEFITRFPQHALAPSAQAALDQLNSGMSDEELVRFFMAREDSLGASQ